MPAKVLVIGFDALEATLIERWIGEGSLPTFARLSTDSTVFHLDNHVELLQDTIWVETTTGRSGARMGWYWKPRQVHSGEARQRPNSPEDFDLTALWDHASCAGRRTAVLDVHNAAPSPDINGLHLRGWGVHYPICVGSDPPEFFEEVERAYGAYPVPHTFGRGCDSVDGSYESLDFLLRRLREAISVKTRLFRDVLDRENWDLFFGAFAEAHCVGHHLWHLHDETSPLHDPDAPPELRNGVREVYTLLDEALGRVLEKAGDTTATLVFLSHGMGPNVGGWQLLPEILLRLGYTPAPPETVRIARSLLPAPAKRAAKRFLLRGGGTLLRSAAFRYLEPLESPRTRAIAERCGGNGVIRLNVADRDPFGSIQPGEEYDAACAELTCELEALRDTTTGEPVVEAVLRADVVFGEGLHPNIPDLIVRFRRSRPITSVTSPRVGTVSTATRAERRTGDHTPHSRLWAHGPGIAAGRSVKGGHVFDLAPTVLKLLDVPVPAGLDGSALKLRDQVVVSPGAKRFGYALR